jgi:hypothetical protein
MDEHLVVAPGDPGVEVSHVLASDDTPARLCLVRQIHADMRLRQRESRMQSMIVAVVVAASAVALAWLYSAGESREGVSMAAPLLTLHEVLWPGRNVPECRVAAARQQSRRRA